jgi:hypothetical protein
MNRTGFANPNLFSHFHSLHVSVGHVLKLPNLFGKERRRKKECRVSTRCKVRGFYSTITNRKEGDIFINARYF